MYHLVYLTTNLINGKIYVGIHSTYNLFDKYLGTGYVLKDAFKKYGKKNFKKEILYYCIEREHALDIEALIVDEEFISRKDTYNLVIGGYGGSLDYISKLSDEDRQKRNENISIKLKGRTVSNGGRKAPVFDIEAKSKCTKLRNKKYGNPGCSDITKKVTSLRLKGKTYEEIYGEEKAIELRKKKKEQTRSKESILKGEIARAITISNYSKEKILEIGNKISKGLKGIPKSEEHRKKLSDAKKLLHYNFRLILAICIIFNNCE